MNDPWNVSRVIEVGTIPVSTLSLVRSAEDSTKRKARLSF